MCTLRQNNHVKEDEMASTCRTNGARKNSNRILVGQPKVKRPLGRPRS
jgi:hypothetical protein